MSCYYFYLNVADNKLSETHGPASQNVISRFRGPKPYSFSNNAVLNI